MTAIIFCFVSAVGFGSAAIFARIGMQGVSPLPSTLISVLFSLVPSMALALIFAFSDISSLTLIAVLWFLVLGAVNFLGGRNFSYQAIGRIGAARSGAILSTAAVFATIFAITLTGERPHPAVLIGTLVVAVGLVTALGKSVLEGTGSGRSVWLGYLLALGAAACYGGTNVIAKELTEEYGSPLMVSAFSLLFGVIWLWPLAGNAAVRELRGARSDLSFVASAGLSGLAAAAGIIFLYYALQRADVVVVAPIVSSNPIITLILAQLFISRLENLTRWLVFGTGVTVTGVVLVVLGSTF